MMMTEWGMRVRVASDCRDPRAPGLINGTIVTRIRTFPLIVTLATAVIFQGIVHASGPDRDHPESFQALTKARLFGIPFDVYLTVFIVIVASVYLLSDQVGHQGWGRGQRGKTSGCPGDQVSQDVGLHHVRLLHRLSLSHGPLPTQSSFGPGHWFTALTAAIVGGAKFLGRRGAVSRRCGRVFVLAVLGNGMQLAAGHL